MNECVDLISAIAKVERLTEALDRLVPLAEAQAKPDDASKLREQRAKTIRRCR